MPSQLLNDRRPPNQALGGLIVQPIFISGSLVLTPPPSCSGKGEDTHSKQNESAGFRDVSYLALTVV